MPARIQQLIIGLGKGKQANIATAGATFLRLQEARHGLTTPKPVFENDAAEIGKGHEFITQTFPSHYEVANRIEKYASAEFVTWAWRSRSATSRRPVRRRRTRTRSAHQSGHHARIAVLLARRAGGRRRRQRDRQSVRRLRHRGFHVPVQLRSGPRVLEVDGQLGRLRPGDDAERHYRSRAHHRKQHARGVHVALGERRRLRRHEAHPVRVGRLEEQPAVERGLLPGSGLQNGLQVRGRMEIGARVPSFQFTARLLAGSPEYNTLVNQTTGTATLSVSTMPTIR